MGLSVWQSNLKGGQYKSVSNARKAMGGHKLSEEDKKVAETDLSSWFAADKDTPAAPTKGTKSNKGKKTSKTVSVAAPSPAVAAKPAATLNGVGDDIVKLTQLTQNGVLSIPAFKEAAGKLLARL